MNGSPEARSPAGSPGPACGAPPISPKLVTYILIGLGALVYLYLMVFWQRPVRAALVWAPAVLIPALLCVREKALVPLLPLLFALGVRSYPVGPFFPNGATLAGFGFFGIYGISKLVWNEPLPGMNRALRLAAAALAVQALSIWLSVQVHGQHFWNAVRDGSSVFLFLPLAFILPDLLRSRRDLIMAARGLVVALLASSLVGVLIYLTTAGFSRVDVSIGYVYRIRVGSLFGAPNVFGGYLELALPVVLAIAITEKSRGWKAMALAAFALGYLSALYTFSRGAFFLTTAGSAIVIIYRFRKRLWVPLLALSALVFFLARNADTFARQLSLVMEPQDLYMQPTLLHRYITYRSLAADFEENLLTGRGWGAREFYWGNSSVFTFWDIRHGVSSRPIRSFGGLNNLLLNHAVKGGIVSLASLALLGMACLSASFSALRHREDLLALALAASLAMFAMHQMVDNLLRWAQVNAFFWMNLGLLISIAGMRASGDETA
ncbi:hypothetical protein JW921_02515 [Candidatus Fermentibacterales bacterium]|nr:hypothetical protein [Candidatus Fermentibacterales bacterium]